MFGNEHESSPPLSLDHYFKIVVYDGYVKYEEAEFHGSAIMIVFQNSEKMADWQPFWIFRREISHGLSLCETLHFVLYSWSSHFAFLELSKYYKIQNGR